MRSLACASKAPCSQDGGGGRVSLRKVIRGTGKGEIWTKRRRQTLPDMANAIPAQRWPQMDTMNFTQCKEYRQGQQAISRRGCFGIFHETCSVFPRLGRLHVNQGGASHCRVMHFELLRQHGGRHAPEYTRRSHASTASHQEQQLLDRLYHTVAYRGCGGAACSVDLTRA